MVHLGPLPGSPRYAGDIGAVVMRAQADAVALARGGADAILVENFGDSPFYKDSLPPETVAALARCAAAVREVAPALPLGINALRNDGLAALGVAVAVGARFIRVNVLIGAMLTDQGIIEGCAAELLRRRAALRADVAILADVLVKHAAPLSPVDLEQLARDTVLRGGADALIVSGPGTGQATPPDRVTAVRATVPNVPVLIGSGATAETIGVVAVDGYIVGTSLQSAGCVDEAKVRLFSDRLHSPAEHDTRTT